MKGNHMKAKSNILSKSKVLLGLLIISAMTVLAVPAFAERTFTVSAPDKAEQEVFVGNDASFSFDITDENGTNADAYTVEITDTTTAAAFEQKDLEMTPDHITGKKATVTVKIPADKIADDTVGEHTIRYKVIKTMDNNQKTSNEITQIARITVKENSDATARNVELSKELHTFIPGEVFADNADTIKLQ